MAFGPLHLMLLPPNEPAAGGEEQNHRNADPIAVLLAEVAQLVATQILVDLAEKSLIDIGGLRQRRTSVRVIGNAHAGRFLSHRG
jgi:hypothetical protein